MNGKIRNKGLLIALLCVVFAISMLPIVLKASAAGETTIDEVNFTVEKGASVRKEVSSAGLRFRSLLSVEEYEGLMSNPSYSDVIFGMVVLPQSYQEETPVTAESLFGENNIYTDSFRNEEGKTYVVHLCDSEMADYEGQKVFSGVLLNVRTENYLREFTCVAYIKVTENGEEKYRFEQGDVRSIVYVAQKALEQGEQDPDGILSGYIEEVKEVDAPYTVKYYLEDASGTFAEKTELTETLRGKIDSSVTAEPKNIENYTYDADNVNDKPSGKVYADGKTELALYYTRSETAFNNGEQDAAVIFANHLTTETVTAELSDGKIKISTVGTGTQTGAIALAAKYVVPSIENAFLILTTEDPVNDPQCVVKIEADGSEYTLYARSVAAEEVVVDLDAAEAAVLTGEQVVTIRIGIAGENASYVLSGIEFCLADEPVEDAKLRVAAVKNGQIDLKEAMDAGVAESIEAYGVGKTLWQVTDGSIAVYEGNSSVVDLSVTTIADGTYNLMIFYGTHEVYAGTIKIITYPEGTWYLFDDETCADSVWSWEKTKVTWLAEEDGETGVVKIETNEAGESYFSNKAVWKPAYNEAHYADYDYLVLRMKTDKPGAILQFMNETSGGYTTSGIRIDSAGWKDYTVSFQEIYAQFEGFRDNANFRIWYGESAYTIYIDGIRAVKEEDSGSDAPADAWYLFDDETCADGGWSWAQTDVTWLAEEDGATGVLKVYTNTSGESYFNNKSMWRAVFDEAHYAEYDYLVFRMKTDRPGSVFQMINEGVSVLPEIAIVSAEWTEYYVSMQEVKTQFSGYRDNATFRIWNGEGAYTIYIDSIRVMKTVKESTDGIWYGFDEADCTIGASIDDNAGRTSALTWKPEVDGETGVLVYTSTTGAGRFFHSRSVWNAEHEKEYYAGYTKVVFRMKADVEGCVFGFYVNGGSEYSGITVGTEWADYEFDITNLYNEYEGFNGNHLFYVANPSTGFTFYIDSISVK